MLSHFRILLSLLFFFADGEDATDDTDDAAAEDRDDSGDESALGDKGKAALNEERKARRQAETEAKDLKARLDKIEADARKDAEEKAKKQGEWEKLATTREAELTEATTKLQGAETELDTLRSYVTADVEAVAKTVREAAKETPAAKVLLEFHPGDDASTTDLIAWTQRAKAQLPGLAAKQTLRGSGENPPPGNPGDITIESPISKRSILS